MRKAFHYRLYPTDAQAVLAMGQPALNRELYNACLEKRREAYGRVGKSLNFHDQANQLKDIRRIRPEFAALNFSMLQATCRRVQRSFDAFFRRVKAGETPGYPRFRSSRRWDSSTFPSYGDGCKLSGKKLYRQGIGQIKVKLHRHLGRRKRCTAEAVPEGAGEIPPRRTEGGPAQEGEQPTPHGGQAVGEGTAARR